MSAFTTRVELHHATWQDYETLHNRMAAEGFLRSIVGADGVRYQLPTAEYVITCDYSGDQVLQKANRAAAATGRVSSVLVTEAVRWHWIGLPSAMAA